MRESETPPAGDIPADDFSIVYVSLWYDGPLMGHAIVREAYWFFEAVEVSAYYDDPALPEGVGRHWMSWRLFPLEGERLLRALGARKLFEDLMSYGNTTIFSETNGTVSTTHPHSSAPAAWQKMWTSEAIQALVKAEGCDTDLSEAERSALQARSLLVVAVGEPHGTPAG